MRGILGLLLALASAYALAQERPAYPCQGCLDDRPSFAMPSSALWYAVERPGTGLSMTVQGGFLVGVYYGFTEAGKPLWYLFTGMLERPQDAPNRLRLVAPLQRVENGPCLGCSWHVPDFLPSPGNATLEFDQANHATLSINGAPSMDMVPFIAGVDHTRLLPSFTDYDFPDLDGTWVAVQEIPQSDGSRRFASHIGRIASLAVTDEIAGWLLMEESGPADGYVLLNLDCRFNRDIPGQPDPHSREVPDCWLSDIVDGEIRDFPVPYANIGASRISAVEPETGVRLTMYRLEYN